MAVVVTAFVVVLGLSLTVQAQDASVGPDVAPSSTPGAMSGWATEGSPVPADPDDGAAASPSAPATVTVEAGDQWFAPNEIQIRSDEPTVLALTGVGQSAHNLTVDELGLQLHVGPGITSEVTLSELPPGSYSFYCSVFGHARAGMHGTLTIE